MFFKVKWGDLRKLFVKKFDVLEKGLPIKTYFEIEKTILVFITMSGTTLYAEIPELEDLTGFKLEYLSDSYELQENPIKNNEESQEADFKEVD